MINATVTMSRLIIVHLHMITAYRVRVFSFGNLEAAHQIVTLHHDFANRTNHLVSHARATLFVQQVHVNALILDCGMDFDGDKEKAGGKDAWCRFARGI